MLKSDTFLPDAAVYHPRNPFTSPLSLLADHSDHFEQNYNEQFSKKSGLYRSIISDVVRDFFECGDLRQGFGVSLCSLP